MAESLSDARAFQERVDGFDEWLREGGNADVADLLRDLLAAHARLRAALTSFRAERDMLRGVGCLEDGDGPCGVCIKCLRVRAEAAEAALTEAKHRAYTEYEQRIDVQARLDLFKHQLSVQEERTGSWHEAYDAIHAQLEELKDCVCDWINEGLIVPDGRLSSMLASASPAAPET